MTERIALDREQMAAFLGIPAKSPQREQLLDAITPSEWAAYEHMKWIEEELNAGRVPPNVRVCR